MCGAWHPATASSGPKPKSSLHWHVAGDPLDAAPPAVDHGHDVGQVQALDHHLHEVLVAAGARHKLLQGELAWRRQRQRRPITGGGVVGGLGWGVSRGSSGWLNTRFFAGFAPRLALERVNVSAAAAFREAVQPLPAAANWLRRN